MAATAPNGVITLVFTDIQDSTGLWERLGDRFRPILDRHNDLIRERIECWDGYEVKSQGDSFMIAFMRGTDAVQCSLDIHRVLERANWPEDVGELLVRIGMHTGEPFLGYDPTGRPDYFGPMVNRAARISAAGHGGQLLISSATRDVLQGSLPGDIELINLGTHKLRGLELPELLFEVRHPDLAPRRHPPLKTANDLKTNLPEPTTSFVGRGRELSELRRMLRQADTRLLTLIGFGGMGKTRTALQLAEISAHDFPDGAFWVECEESTTAEALVQKICYTLRIHLQPQPSVREQLWNFLRERVLLLVLDNTEQIPDIAPLVREMLVQAVGVKCLVTTRRALDIAYERLVEIRPLPLADAEMLFAQRARARKDDFILTGENTEHVAELCRKLECVPLAIELAASRIVGMTPLEILSRLDERFRLLQTRAPDLPPRQRALRGAIDWSYDLLTDDDKELFAQLAVFAGGFTMEDAEAVCDSMDPFEGIMELRRQSMLRAETEAETQQTRYVMLESVRDYAAEKLRGFPDGGSDVRRRHAQHFLAYGEKRAAQIRTRDEARALDELWSAYNNLRTAMEWAQQEGEHAVCARLSLVLYPLMYRRGFWADVRACLEAGLDATAGIPGDSRALRARISHYLATVSDDLGEIETAIRYAEQSLALRRELGEPRGIAEGLNLLGLLAMDPKNPNRDAGRAQSILDEGLALLTDRDHLLRGMILHNLALVASRSDRVDEARTLYESALQHRRAASDARGEAETLGNLGVLAQVYAENLEEAKRLYMESLTILRRLRDRHWIAVMLFNLGEIAEAENDIGGAVTLFVHSELLFRELQSALVGEPAASLERLSQRTGAEEWARLLEAARLTDWESTV